MFLVFNREKIYTYLVSIVTVILLFVFANYIVLNDKQAIQTSSSNEKLLPIYNVKTEEKNVALTMNCAWSQHQMG